MGAQGLVEKVVFEHRARCGKTLSQTTSWSKKMEGRTNSTNKALQQDRESQVPGMSRGHALEQTDQRKINRRVLKKVTGSQIT